MIDPELIKETYADMPDEKLIRLVKQDGTSITYEAFILLKREYSKRKLDPLVLAEAEQLREEESKNKIRNNLERESILINDLLWKGVFQQKAEGKKNTEIIEWLIQVGVEPEIATKGISELAVVINNAYKKAKKIMIASFISILLGIISGAGFFSGALNSNYLIYGGIFIVAALRFFPANNKMYRLCEKAMMIIEQEKIEIK
ncbi:MAG: hypothetical protein HOP10_14225 [Chitinophagaceae bacterium]|nr:hypothetical protein [Chitinophagaceae bacterium]